MVGGKGAGDMRISVNGASAEVEGEEVSYAEILRIAFDNKPIGHTWVVTVHHPAGPDADGTLQDGGTVRVTDGAVFNVYAAGGEPGGGG